MKMRFIPETPDEKEFIEGKTILSTVAWDSKAGKYIYTHESPYASWLASLPEDVVAEQIGTIASEMVHGLVFGVGKKTPYNVEQMMGKVLSEINDNFRQMPDPTLRDL